MAPRGERKLVASSDLGLTLGTQIGMSYWLAIKWSLDCIDLTALPPGHPTIPSDNVLWKMHKLKLEPFGLKMWAAKAPCPLPFSDGWDSVPTLVFVVLLGFDKPDVLPSQPGLPNFGIKVAVGGRLHYLGVENSSSQRIWMLRALSWLPHGCPPLHSHAVPCEITPT